MDFLFASTILANVLLVYVLISRGHVLKLQWFSMCAVVPLFCSLPLYRAMSTTSYENFDLTCQLAYTCFYILAMCETHDEFVWWSMTGYLLVKFVRVVLQASGPYWLMVDAWEIARCLNLSLLLVYSWYFAGGFHARQKGKKAKPAHTCTETV